MANAATASASLQLLQLQQLARWRDAGWLRKLDVALAGFIHEAEPQAPASLLLAVALLAQLEGRGHSALPLATLMDDPAATLGWSAQAQLELKLALASLPRDAKALTADWAGLAVLQIDPAQDDGNSPLVLAGGLLYLRRYWRYERQVAAQLQSRVRLLRALAAGAEAPAVDKAAARVLLDGLFGPVQPDVPLDRQRLACALSLRAGLTIVTGGPGTGKTYTAARALVLLQALQTLQGQPPLRVALAAPTGKAAARLRQSINQALQGLQTQRPLADAAGLLEGVAAALGPARTLHALLGTQPGTRRFRHDAANPLPLDLVFVDEASMVHLEMMAQLLQALPASARLVLLGDKDQLASVEAGAVMAELCQGFDASFEVGAVDAADPAVDDPPDNAAHLPGSYRPDTAQWLLQVSGQALPPQALGPGSDLAQQTVMLRQSHRFDGPIGQLAQAINRGDGAAALALLGSGSSGGSSSEGASDRALGAGLALVLARDAAALLPLVVGAGRAATEAAAPRDWASPALEVAGAGAAAAAGAGAGAGAGYRDYLEKLAQRPPALRGHTAVSAQTAAAFDDWALSVLRGFDGLRVLCAVREGPWGVLALNAAIERALGRAGFLSPHQPWYEGRPVMVTRNDPAAGVFNGDVGIVLRPPTGEGSLRCYFAQADSLHSVAVGRLADVETAFAMTVHKSQGSEFGHVLLVLPPEDGPVLTRELLYTGITRARRSFTLVTPDTSLLLAAASRRTRRISGLATMLAAEPSMAVAGVEPSP